MRFLDIKNEFITFDAFTKVHHPDQKVFITHMYNADKLELPVIMPTIYTTKHIAKQLLFYFKEKSLRSGKAINISESNFKLLSTQQTTKVKLSNNKHLTVCCVANEIGNNLILAIKYGCSRFIYGGIYTDIRSAILDDTFANYINIGVSKLFLSTQRATEKCEAREMDNAFDEIEKLITLQKPGIPLHVQVPVFGYENFVIRLSNRLGKWVYVAEMLYKLFVNQEIDVTIFQDQINKAKVIIISNEKSPSSIEHDFHEFGITTIKITDSTPNCTRPGYCELQWSPLPTPFPLELLTTFTSPEQIISINHTALESEKIPPFLWQLRKKQATKKVTSPQKEAPSIAEIYPQSGVSCTEEADASLIIDLTTTPTNKDASSTAEIYPQSEVSFNEEADASLIRHLTITPPNKNASSTAEKSPQSEVPFNEKATAPLRNIRRPILQYMDDTED